ncbi:MAG: YjcZ family sporulation protein [Paenibacillus sp.]|nr:YjcZ family sporulation protein [Paenibacillus sp.]MDR0268305.1 YjcZ family sporulation protein [Paenibacillus sp.]
MGYSCGGGGMFGNTGAILVLFILLVIITRSFWI